MLIPEADCSKLRYLLTKTDKQLKHLMDSVEKTTFVAEAIEEFIEDFFRGPVVDNVRLAGLEHAVSVTAVDGKIFIRNYRIQLKKDAGSGNTPRVELDNMGPSFDLVIRRKHTASDDLFKRATKQPKTAKPKKKKNVSHDVLGNKLGRIHMTRQDLSQLPDRRMKRIKKVDKKPEEDKDASSPAKKTRHMSEED